MRYTTIRPCAWSSNLPFDDETNARSLTVFEEAGEPRDTGLLDANGTPLYRVGDKNPIGFATRK